MIVIGDKKIFTIVEATELLQLSYQTVRKYIKNGRLKGQLVGNKWYVTDESIKRFAFGEDANEAPSVVSSNAGEEVQ